jgi:hypothetical protein
MADAQTILDKEGYHHFPRRDLGRPTYPPNQVVIRPKSHWDVNNPDNRQGRPLLFILYLSRFEQAIQ